jgi:hypothetical protein
LGLLLLLGCLCLLQLLQLLELQRLHVVATTQTQCPSIDTPEASLCQLALHATIGNLLQSSLASKLLHTLHAGTSTKVHKAGIASLRHKTCCYLLLHPRNHQIVHTHRALDQPIGHATSIWLLQETGSSWVGHTQSIEASVGVHG